MFNRPTPEDIDNAVSSLLATEPVGFKYLELEAVKLLPRIANPIQVRQAAWRLIRRGQASLTKELKVVKSQ